MDVDVDVDVDIDIDIGAVVVADGGTARNNNPWITSCVASRSKLVWSRMEMRK